MPSLSRTWPSRGLSLLEVALALFLLSLGLLATIGVFSGGLGLVSRSDEITEATELGNQLLERIRNAGPGILPTEDSIFDGRYPDTRGLHFPPDPYPGSSSGRYQLVVRTEEIEQGLVSVTVEVYWDAAAPVVMESYFYRGAP